MLSSFRRTSFIRDIINYFLPGINTSKQKSYYSMMVEPVIIKPRDNHTATVIFLHGLGDTGHGWSTVCATDLRLSHVKYICPHAPSRPVTLNLGMQMPAWFDVFGLTPDAEEDEDGINESVKIVHSMIDEEIRNGIPAERIIIAGFSMGGALALYAGLTYDKPLAGIVGLSSFLVQRDKIPGNHTANKNAHILMGHGDADFVVPRTFGEMTAQFIQTFDPNIHIKIYPGMAHSSCPEELSDVKNFLMKQIPKL